MELHPASYSAVANLRREYTRGGLRRRDLPPNPMTLFNLWLSQACEAQLPDPTAMTIATVDSQGQPWQRIVLLKAFDQSSMTFFTNLESRKAQHLKDNPKISLLFPWHPLERQVMVLGQVEPLPRDQVERYFETRPRESQLGAWSSAQSQPIANREVLLSRYAAFAHEYQQRCVPLPEFWGGFRVLFHTLEFWQGGSQRLHDRFIYQKSADCWKIIRLAP